MSRPLRSPTAAQSLMVGGLVASLVPAHVLLAILGAGGAVVGIAERGLKTWRATHTWPEASAAQVRLALGILTVAVATVIWGAVTGHGFVPASLAPEVRSFNSIWATAVLVTALASLGVLSIPIAWWIARNDQSGLSAILAGTMAILVAGAIVWGARLGDFNMFHAYFGAMVAYAIPLAAISLFAVWRRLDRPWRLALVVALVFQLVTGVGTGLLRLQAFGPHQYKPIPTSILDAIEGLPANAKIAYQCLPLEEIGIWVPGLASIDVHTGRRVVPLCFQANLLGASTTGVLDPTKVAPAFLIAPQREIFPDSSAKPSPEVVLAFLRRNGIAYLLTDDDHPDVLGLGGTVIVAREPYTLIQLPIASSAQAVGVATLPRAMVDRYRKTAQEEAQRG